MYLNTNKTTMQSRWVHPVVVRSGRTRGLHQQNTLSLQDGIREAGGHSSLSVGKADVWSRGTCGLNWTQGAEGSTEPERAWNPAPLA